MSGGAGFTRTAVTTNRINLSFRKHGLAAVKSDYGEVSLAGTHPIRLSAKADPGKLAKYRQFLLDHSRQQFLKDIILLCGSVIATALIWHFLF